MASLPTAGGQCFFRTLSRLRKSRPASRLSFDTITLRLASSANTDNEVPYDNTRETEELTDVSNLSPNHYRQVHGQPPELPYKDLVMRQRLFARFGFESQEDPRIMWPSRKTLLDLEQEEIEERMSLTERLRLLHEEKAAKEKEKFERREMIEKRMKEMPKLIADYRKRLEKADQDVKQRKAKNDILLEEAREFFGYNIQQNDPKFEQMVEEKAEEEKKLARKHKKEEKLKRAAAKLELEAKKVAEKSAQTQSSQEKE